MARPLEDLRETLHRGQMKSGESSYDRHLPARNARPDLFEAQTGLREYTSQNPDDEAGWRLRALAEECVTNYQAAIACLERAMAISGQRGKKDLKNLARLRDYASSTPK